MKVKRLFFKLLSKVAMGTFKLMSYLPLLGRFGKRMYAACLFGEASGLYFGENYTPAVSAYHRALEYAHGMDEDPAIGFCIGEAWKALGEMYENGLGVNKDDFKAEEYYLRAGGRGNLDYEHKVATKSWYEQNWK